MSSKRSAPPLDCARCGRRIGRDRNHWIVPWPVVAETRVLCSRCVDELDLWDEPMACGTTRAGAAHLLAGWWGEAYIGREQ